MAANFIVFNLSALLPPSPWDSAPILQKRMIFGAFNKLPNSTILHLASTHPHPPLHPQDVRAEFKVLDPGEDALGRQMQRRQK